MIMGYKSFLPKRTNMYLFIKKEYITVQQARNQRGGQSGNFPPRNFQKHMYLLGTATSYIIQRQ